MSGMAIEDALTLGLAGTAHKRQIQARRLLELSGRSDPRRLLAVLGRQRLIHLGIARLRELGAEELTAELTARTTERETAVRWQAVEQEMLTHAIVGALGEHHVPAIPIKGAVLARRLFDDPGLRESDDVDLLVAAHQLEEAVEVVRSRFGYSAPRDARHACGRPLLHYGLIHPDGLPTVELHWRVHWYEERSGGRMVARSVVEEGLPRLSPADEIACLLLVYARDGFAGVRPLADLAAWWDRNVDRLPAGGIGRFAREFPELGPSLAVSAALSQALTGAPASNALTTHQPWSDRMKRAARLANWGLVGQDEQIYADIAMVDLLLTPPTQAWLFLRRQVLLPLDVAADRLVETESTRARLVLAAVLHVPRIVVRLVLALAGTVGSRTRSPQPADSGDSGDSGPGR